MIKYEPTWESLKQFTVPEWYQDAKFGIFIHWIIYSVPAFVPKGQIDIDMLLNGEGDFGVSPHSDFVTPESPPSITSPIINGRLAGGSATHLVTTSSKMSLTTRPGKT